MSSNKRQHLVPQFYLKQFAGADDRLCCLDIARGRLFSTTPNNVALEQYAFSIREGGQRDDSFDKINNNVEELCGQEFKNLKAGAIDQKVITAFLAFTSNMIMRSRTLRDSQLGQSEKIADFMRRIPQSVIESARTDPAMKLFGFEDWQPLEGAEAVEKAAKLTYPISQIMIEQVAQRLSERRLIVLLAEPTKPFITSDDPVTFLREGQPVANVNKGHLSLLDDAEVDVFLPISPHIACLWQNGAPDIRREKLTVEECERYNKIIATSAYQQIYTSSDDVLRAVAGLSGIQIVS